MRILLVHDYGTATWGAELHILGLREGLRARGHDARLFTSRASLTPAEVLSDYHCFGATGPLQKVVQTCNPSAYFGLRRVLSEFRPEVVHLQMSMYELSPLILPLLAEIPTLYQAATYEAICPTGLKLLPDGTPCTHRPGGVCRRTGCLTTRSWPLYMLQRALRERWRHVIDLITALSRSMKTRLEAAGIGPVEVVYNGMPERPPRAPLSGPPLVGYAGRLVREKGVHILVRAMAEVVKRAPEARLLIVGDGPERAALAALIERLGLADRTTMTGFLPRAEMERRLDTAWVQVVPSVWDEPFGNVAAEASMRGTAVVASAVAGPAEIVRDGETGIIVPPGDPEALARPLVTLLRDRGAAERLGRAGRERALAEFNESRLPDRFLDLYDRCRAVAARR